MQSPSRKSKLGFKEKYEVVERVGAGKMGIIFKVRKRVKESPDEE